MSRQNQKKVARRDTLGGSLLGRSGEIRECECIHTGRWRSHFGRVPVSLGKILPVVHGTPCMLSTSESAILATGSRESTRVDIGFGSSGVVLLEGCSGVASRWISMGLFEQGFLAREVISWGIS